MALRGGRSNFKQQARRNRFPTERARQFGTQRDITVGIQQYSTQ